MKTLLSCVVCAKTFRGDTRYVPQMRNEGITGGVCRACLEGLNKGREAIGYGAVPIHPKAYEPETAKEDER